MEPTISYWGEGAMFLFIGFCIYFLLRLKCVMKRETTYVCDHWSRILFSGDLIPDVFVTWTAHQIDQQIRETLLAPQTEGFLILANNNWRQSWQLNEAWISPYSYTTNQFLKYLSCVPYFTTDRCKINYTLIISKI